jgi:hypothetical protein
MDSITLAPAEYIPNFSGSQVFSMMSQEKSRGPNTVLQLQEITLDSPIRIQIVKNSRELSATVGHLLFNNHPDISILTLEFSLKLQHIIAKTVHILNMINRLGRWACPFSASPNWLALQSKPPLLFNSEPVAFQ